MRGKTLILVSVALSVCLSLHAQDTLVKTERIDSSLVEAHINGLRGNVFIANPLMSKNIVSALGENDILKTIAYRPGVSNGVEGTQSFYVRGAGLGGNRIELDGVPLYRSTHLLGLVSSFPSEMVSSVSFTTGGLKPSSGNLTSSLTEISLKADIADRFGASVSVSPYMEDVYIETPISKCFTARMSARVSPVFPIADKVVGAYSSQGQSMAVHDIGGRSYDLMANMVLKPFPGFSLDAMYFRTEDAFHYSYGERIQGFASEEQAGKVGLLWDGEKWGRFEAFWYWSSNSALHEEAKGKNLTEVPDWVLLYIRGGYAENGGRAQYSLNFLKYFSVCLGWDYSARSMNYENKVNVVKSMAIMGKGKESAYTLSAPYAQVGVHVPTFLDVTASVRYSKYELEPIPKDGPVIFKYPDTHVLADIVFWKGHGIEITYDQSWQYYHMLEGMPTGWSQDLMIASNNQFPAERMRQVYAGLFGKTSVGGKADLTYTFGAYKRWMEGLVSFKNAAYVFGMRDNVDSNQMVEGTGSSYGLEMWSELHAPKVSVELAYTYSRSSRLFPEMNFGKEFNFRFDRPHMLNIHGNYDFFEKKKPSGTVHKHGADISIILSSGHLMTASRGLYEASYPGVFTFMEDDRNILEDIGQLNNFRMPTYFRVDLGYAYSLKIRRILLDVNVSLFNVLNRHNAFQYFYEGGEWKQLSILPIMPSVRVMCSF